MHAEYAARGETLPRSGRPAPDNPMGAVCALHRQDVRHPRHQRPVRHRPAGEPRLRAPAQRRHRVPVQAGPGPVPGSSSSTSPSRLLSSRMAAAIWKCTSRSPATRRSSTPARLRRCHVSTAVTRFHRPADSDSQLVKQAWSGAAACPSPSAAEPRSRIASPGHCRGFFVSSGEGCQGKFLVGWDKIRPYGSEWLLD